METFDQYRVRVIKDKIESLKKEILEWEIRLEEITGISEDIPNLAMAREMLEKVKRGEPL